MYERTPPWAVLTVAWIASTPETDWARWADSWLAEPQPADSSVASTQIALSIEHLYRPLPSVTVDLDLGGGILLDRPQHLMVGSRSTHREYVAVVSRAPVDSATWPAIQRHFLDTREGPQLLKPVHSANRGACT